MILSKAEKAVVTKVYKAYWESYCSGDIETLASLLDENYTQIGSAETEVFIDKKGAVQFLVDTIDQIAGNVDLRNRDIKMDILAELILFTELTDLYVLSENEWIFHSKFRASSLLQKKEDGWKFIHQHSSFPDIRTDAGDNMSIEKITTENLHLRDAVKKRTIELEYKNRELEIESSLERVRTVAMSMNKPDDMLETCQSISNQLELLHVKEIRNIQTAIFYEDKEVYINYEYYAKHDKKIITETSYKDNKLHNTFVQQLLKGKKNSFETELKGEKLKDWYAYQQESKQFADTYLETATSLHASALRSRSLARDSQSKRSAQS